MTASQKQQQAPPPLPFHLQFVAGAVAGISEILIMYPLDVVKTRFQLQQKGNKAYSSVADCFRQIVRDEGPGRLYRGIIPPILMEAPKRATKFAANEQYSTLYKKHFGGYINAQFMPVLTGVSAGCTEAFIVVPFDLVKIRLQDKASAGKYANTIDCIRKIIQQEGAFTFFKGMESTLWRHGVWSGIYFGLIGFISDGMKARNGDNAQLSTLEKFTAGVAGGTVATLFNTPFDVVKTRIQNNVYSGWTLSGCFHIARTEGVRSLWNGFVPKVLRLGPGGGIMLVVFEAVTAWLRKNQ